jgi:hypothetical protein
MAASIEWIGKQCHGSIALEIIVQRAASMTAGHRCCRRHDFYPIAAPMTEAAQTIACGIIALLFFDPTAAA